MKYRITFSKDHGGRYYRTIVEARDEKEAFFKARDEAIEKGIKLPNEIWTRTEPIDPHNHAQNKDNLRRQGDL